MNEWIVTLRHLYDKTNSLTSFPWLFYNSRNFLE